MKTWIVSADIEKIGVYKARTEGQAKQIGMSDSWDDYVTYTDMRAKRVKWLDKYDDVDSPGAKMAMLRHGWDVYTGAIGEYLLMPEDMKSEDDYRTAAEKLGAKYPDICKLEED